MEPLNPAETLETKAVKKADAKDRVCLTKELTAKVDSWLNQIEVKFKGYIKVTRSDLVNYILNEKSQDLSEADFQSLQSLHYDPVKFMQWALQQVKRSAEKWRDSFTGRTFKNS